MTSLKDLKQAITDFIAYYNQEAKPIKWTYTVEKLEKKLEPRIKLEAEQRSEQKGDQNIKDKVKQKIKQKQVNNSKELKITKGEIKVA
jgi:hypothetical protein